MIKSGLRIFEVGFWHCLSEIIFISLLDFSTKKKSISESPEFFFLVKFSSFLFQISVFCFVGILLFCFSFC